MRCLYCRHEIPASAEFCGHCNARVERSVPAAELRTMDNVLARLSSDLRAKIRQLQLHRGSSEALVNPVRVGNCPQCGSADTDDCGQFPEQSDVLIGHCLDCGQLWCALCGEFFAGSGPTAHKCSLRKLLESSD